MSSDLNVGDLAGRGDMTGRITKIELIDGKPYGTVHGKQYPLTNLYWVPDSEQIERLSEQQKQQHFELKRSQT